MPVDVSKLRPYRTPIADNRRWANFDSRPGDIVVCTPAKCGTTWTQTIVHSLLWPDGDAPGGVMELSPWIEFELFPIEDVLSRLATQRHRRTMKSHSPADELPVFPDAQYVIVARDGRDAFMSMCNHMERFKALDHLNARASADGVAPLPNWNGDVHGFFAIWLEQAGHFEHLASWWPRRHDPNVYLLHYNDLKADLGGEMRKLAGWLGLSLREDQWPAAIQRCTFEAMRERGGEIGPFELAFEGGAKGFLFQGTNGRWRDVLTREELAAYDRRVKELVSPELAAWIEHGRSALRRE
jgi:aryl sulfotransferase